MIEETHLNSGDFGPGATLLPLRQTQNTTNKLDAFPERVIINPYEKYN